jgi:ribonuclease D
MVLRIDMAKIHKIQGDITSEIAGSFKVSVAIDTEATGLQIPERDKLSLIQICGENMKFILFNLIEKHTVRQI